MPPRRSIPKRRTRAGPPSRILVVKNRKQWSRIRDGAGSKLIVVFIKNGPKYLVPQEITYRQVFKQSSDARKFRNVVFVELDFRDIGVQDLVDEVAGRPVEQGHSMFAAWKNGRLLELLDRGFQGSDIDALITRHSGEPPKDAKLQGFGLLAAIAGSVCSGALAVLYMLGLGPFGTDRALLRRAEMRFSTASRRYYQAAAGTRSRRSRVKTDSNRLSDLRRDMQDARLSLERMKAAIHEKALHPEKASKQPIARRVLRPALYDSEDDGRYYSDEEIKYRKGKAPWDEQEEFPTGVSSGSEGDDPEEDRRQLQKELTWDSDEDEIARQPLDQYGRPIDLCPDIVRLDPEVP